MTKFLLGVASGFWIVYICLNHWRLVPIVAHFVITALQSAGYPVTVG